jgi:hypothetical protein
MGKKMKCHKHPHREAAGVCNFCGKGLCAECVSRLTPPSCEQCFLQQNFEETISIYIDLSITFIIFGLFLYFAAFHSKATFGGSLYVSSILTCGYLGWRAVGSLIPNGIFLTGFALILFLVLRMCVGFFLGIIIGPVYLIIRIWKLYILITSKKALKTIMARDNDHTIKNELEAENS